MRNLHNPTYNPSPLLPTPKTLPFNITRDSPTNETELSSIPTAYQSPTQRLHIIPDVDLPSLSTLDTADTYNLFNIDDIHSLLLKEPKPTNTARLNTIKQEAPQQQTENNYITTSNINLEPEQTEAITSITNTITPTEPVPPTPILTESHCLEQPQQPDNTSTQQSPTEHLHEFKGYSLSALKIMGSGIRRDNTYLILINIQTQKTHITQINPIQSPSRIKTTITTWIQEHNPHQQCPTNTIHTSNTENPSDDTNVMATKFQTLINETTTEPTRINLPYKHSQILIHSGHLQNQYYDTEQHTNTTKILQNLFDRYDYNTVLFNTYLNKLNSKMTNTASQNTRYQYKRYSSIRQTFGQLLHPTQLTPTRMMRHERTSNNNVRIEHRSPDRPSYIFRPDPDNATRNETSQRFQISQGFQLLKANINWEAATITTEFKTTRNNIYTGTRSSIQKRTTHIRQGQLPSWKYIFYIMIHKLITSWTKAITDPNNTTQYNHEQITRWPTFRPLLILKATTPIMIFTLLFLIPKTTGQTVNKPNTNLLKSIPNFHNRMDDAMMQHKPYSGIKNHFIYNWQGHAITNPSVHYYSTHYQACDVQILQQHLDTIMKHHNILCSYSFNSTIEQTHLIKAKDPHHILLNKKMNIIQARETCNSINAQLIEVRTTEQTRRLETFMTIHDIKQTFSGVYYDQRIQEILYSNGDYVNDNTGNETIPIPYGAYYGTPTTWKNILNYANDRDVYKPIFLYSTKTVHSLVIQANYQHGAYSTQNYKHHHHSATAYPICSTPRATLARDLVLQQWQNQCQITQSNLNQKLAILNTKLNNIKPVNLPKSPKSIKLFGNYNQIRAKRSITSPYNQNPTHNLTTLCLLYLKDATQATQHWLEKHSLTTPTNPMTNRSKRTFLPIPFLPTATIVYNAIQFIADTFIKYFAHQPLHDNPTNEQAHQFINSITKQNAYDEDFIQTTNFILITTTQTKLQLHIDSIIAYLEIIHNQLSKLYNSRYKSLPNDFITQPRYEAIRYKIHKDHGVNIPQKLMDNKIFLDTSQSDYVMTLALPLQPADHDTDFFRITPMPVWINSTRYTPAIPHEIFGIPRKGTQAFTVTTETELADCKANPYCETAKGTQEASEPPCGINQFFHKTKNCQYTKDIIQTHWFHQLENVIYYSIRPNTTISMHLDCTGNQHFGIGTTKQIDLHDYGETTLPFNCQAHINGNTYRPAIRTLYNLHSASKEQVIIRPVKPNSHFQLNNQTTTIIFPNDHSNPTIPQFYKNAFFATIAMTITIPTALVMTYNYCKALRTAKIVKGADKKDIKKLQRYQVKKQKHKEEKEALHIQTKSNRHKSKNNGDYQELSILKDDQNQIDHMYTNSPQPTQIQVIQAPHLNIQNNTAPSANNDKDVIYSELMFRPPVTKQLPTKPKPSPNTVYSTRPLNTEERQTLYPNLQNNQELCPYCNYQFHNMQDKQNHIIKHHSTNNHQV
jgi:hypothetical protein